MSFTVFLATLGAATGTAALVWDILKWFRDGPRLRIMVRSSVAYMDAEVIKTETTEHGESTTFHTYNHIEIVNTGTMPTTILTIYVEGSLKEGFGKMSLGADQFKVHFGKKLPHVLGVGEVLSCRVRDEIVNTMFRQTTPWLMLSVAHKKEPIAIKLKKSRGSEES